MNCDREPASRVRPGGGNGEASPLSRGKPSKKGSREAGGCLSRGELPISRLLQRGQMVSFSGPAGSLRWSLDPYRGCSHNCLFCPARETHRGLGLDPIGDFSSRVLVKQDVAEVLSRDLLRLSRRGEPRGGIAIGTVSDPYQPLEREIRNTRACLEVLSRREGLHVEIWTRSDLVTDDLHLLKRLARRNHLKIHPMLATTEESLTAGIEPGSVAVGKRLEAVQALKGAGLIVEPWISPLIAGLNDDEDSLQSLFGELAATGIRRVVCEVLEFRPPSRALLMRWLEQHDPEGAEAVKSAYGSQPRPSPLVLEQMRRRVRRVRDNWGLLGARRGQEPGGSLSSRIRRKIALHGGASAASRGGQLFDQEPVLGKPQGWVPRPKNTLEQLELFGDSPQKVSDSPQE